MTMNYGATLSEPTQPSMQQQQRQQQQHQQYHMRDYLVWAETLPEFNLPPSNTHYPAQTHGSMVTRKRARQNTVQTDLYHSSLQRSNTNIINKHNNDGCSKKIYKDLLAGKFDGVDQNGLDFAYFMKAMDFVRFEVSGEDMDTVDEPEDMIGETLSSSDSSDPDFTSLISRQSLSPMASHAVEGRSHLSAVGFGNVRKRPQKTRMSGFELGYRNKMRDLYSNLFLNGDLKQLQSWVPNFVEDKCGVLRPSFVQCSSRGNDDNDANTMECV